MNKTLRNFGITSLIMAFGAAAGVSANAGGPGRYYVGAGAGTSMGQHLMRSTFYSIGGTDPIFKDTRKYMKKNAFSGQVFGGYLYNVNIFSLGAELEIALGQEAVRYDGHLEENYGFKLHRQYTVRLLTKLGMNLSDKFSAYALLGAANSRFKLDYIASVDGIDNGPFNNNQKKNLWAFVPGAEISYHINDNWSAGVTYTCDIYQLFDSRKFDQDAGGGAPYSYYQTKISPVFHNIMARVTYRF